MIRIVAPGTKLVAEDLVGRWVLKDERTHWQSLHRPRFVKAAYGTRIEIEEEKAVLSQDDKGRPLWLLSGTGAREPDGFMPISRIAAICDTHDEVNRILVERRAGEDEYSIFVARMKDRLKALAGPTAAS